MHKFPIVSFWITLSIYFGLGVWLSVAPDELLRTFGVDKSNAAIRIEIRAFYGGIELGIAAVMFILWRQKDIPSALLIGGIPLACIALGRFIGFAIDGYSSLHMGLACTEFVGFLCCIIGRIMAQAETREST